MVITKKEVVTEYFISKDLFNSEIIPINEDKLYKKWIRVSNRNNEFGLYDFNRGCIIRDNLTGLLDLYTYQGRKFISKYPIKMKLVEYEINNVIIDDYDEEMEPPFLLSSDVVTKKNLCDYVSNIDEYDADAGIVYASVKIDLGTISTFLHVTYKDGTLIGMAYTDIDGEKFYEVKENDTINDLVRNVVDDLSLQIEHNNNNKQEQMRKLLKVYK